jgi:hypothetical protein
LRWVEGALAIAHDQGGLADVLGAEDDDFGLEGSHLLGFVWCVVWCGAVRCETMRCEAASGGRRLACSDYDISVRV